MRWEISILIDAGDEKILKLAEGHILNAERI